LSTSDYVWDDRAKARLRELWATGQSATVIAEIMGGGLSRSAILGKASRIGLYRQQRRKTVRVGRVTVPIIRLTSASARELRNAVPPDGRTLTQRLFGDPPPGRSALDKRKSPLSTGGEVVGKPLDAAKARAERAWQELSTGQHVRNPDELLAEQSHGVFMEDRHSNSKAV
jgi:hypothetical protein